jgi:aminoglycoside 2'-N-acetyltransferase I
MTPLAARLVRTEALTTTDITAIRRVMDAAFDSDFTEDDWLHALGGWHALIDDGDLIVAHGAVVPRTLYVSGQPVRAGYVEAVAVLPSRQRTGLGTAVMQALTDLTRHEFDLGALSTGEWSFYQRLGWERWQGATWVHTRDGRLMRTADEDEGIMVLRCAASHDLDLTADIVCEERPGDSW